MLALASTNGGRTRLILALASISVDWGIATVATMGAFPRQRERTLAAVQRVDGSFHEAALAEARDDD